MIATGGLVGTAIGQIEPVNVADLVSGDATPSAAQTLGNGSLYASGSGGSSGAEVRHAGSMVAAEPLTEKKQSLRERLFRGDGWKRAETGERMRNRSDAAGLRIEFDSEVVSDDNITYAPSGDEVSDVIFRFRPGLFFDLGEVNSDEGSFASLGYRPTISLFADNDDENSFDHDVSVSFGQRGAKLQSTLETSYRTLSEASLDVGQRTDREVVNADLLMEYALGGKTGLRADLGYERADYDVFSDHDEWGADLYATYAISAKTSLGVGYGYGELRDNEYQRALARADWQTTAKLALAAWGGADFRSSGASDETTGVFGVELGGDLREGTRVRFGTSRDIGASALIDSESYTLTTFSAAIEQRLGCRFTGVLEAGIEDYDYSGGGELADSRSDESVFVRPALRYGLKDELSAEIFYAFRDNDSSVDLLDFENNQFGASVHYEF